MTPESVQRTYITLIVLQTLAASMIWGVNTLFLLDAGLSLTEAFIANAAFTAGMVLFEVPTGVVADAQGRRISFMLGAATLLVTTMAYLALWYTEAGLGWWILVSALIGLGFTFSPGQPKPGWWTPSTRPATREPSRLCSAEVRPLWVLRPWWERSLVVSSAQ